MCENLLALLVERSAVSVVALRLGMTGLLPRNDFQTSHWPGDDDCMELSSTTDVLGFTPRQLPPSPREPQPEPLGRCLMPG